ncbi:MAG: 50S ribosomal protein L6 [Candidatus Dojkabacteria bacterium]
MSRVGLSPIKIEESVTVALNANVFTATGPKGELKVTIPNTLEVKIESDVVNVSRKNEEKAVKSIHGTVRSLIANAIKGVKDGFEKKLLIEGVGYRVKSEGAGISMNLGWNHPVVIQPPVGITFEVIDEVTMLIKGIDKQQVGEVAAQIRNIRKPEPYKGKGIMYDGEVVRRKERKVATAD